MAARRVEPYGLFPERFNCITILSLVAVIYCCVSSSVLIAYDMYLDNFAQAGYRQMFIDSSDDFYNVRKVGQLPFGPVDRELQRPGIGMSNMFFMPFRYLSSKSWAPGFPPEISSDGDPFPMQIDIHLFDVLNPDDTANGQEVVVQESEPIYVEESGGCVEIDGLLLDRLNVVRFRKCKFFTLVPGMQELQSVMLDDPFTIPHVLFATLQANGLEKLTSYLRSEIAGSKETKFRSYYPMFLTLQVDQALGLNGEASPDPLALNLTGEEFSLRILQNIPLSYAQFAQILVGSRYGIDGLAHKYVDLGGETALCSFDRDCIFPMGTRGQNGTFGECNINNAFCDPVRLDGYRLDAIPLGSFYDRVELPWDYTRYRTEGERLMLVDADLGLQAELVNVGSELQLWSGMWTWRLSNFPQRKENCESVMRGYVSQETKSLATDSPGFDCDSPDTASFAGQMMFSESMVLIQPIYVSMYSKGDIAKPCVLSLECKVFSRSYEILAEETFGYVVCASFGIQHNVRLAYTATPLIFPNAKDSLVPLLYMRRHRCLSERYYAADFDDIQHRMDRTAPVFFMFVSLCLCNVVRVAVYFYLGCSTPMVQPSEFRNGFPE